MFIRRITQAERDQFGRLAYEARQAGKSWFHVGQETVSRLVEPGKDPSSTAQYLCREYALRYRQPWPIPIAGPPFTGDAAIDAFNSRAARQDAIDELLSGDKAKALRERLDISRKELAVMARRSPFQVRQYEEGKGGGRYTDRRIWRALEAEDAKRKPKRDWLILTDGPARFASELPASA